MKPGEHETEAANKALGGRPDRLEKLGRDAGDLERLQTSTSDLGEQVYELAVLNNLHKAVESVLSVQDMLDAIVEHCVSMLDAGQGSIFLLDLETNELVLRAACGPLSETILGTRVQIGEGVAGNVAAEGRPLIVADIREDERFGPWDSQRYTSHSFVSVPVTNGDTLTGVLNVSGKRNAEPFTDDDLNKLEMAAEYSASALGGLPDEHPQEGLSNRLHNELDRTISRLTETNRELKQLRESSQAVFKSVPLGLLAFDKDYNLLFANDPAGKLLSLGSGEDLKDTLMGLCLHQPGRNWPAELERVLSNGTELRFDEAALRVPGDDLAKTVRVIASPMLGENDSIDGGIIVVEDITERVKLERDLAANEHHAVIGKLAARVAHEVNNPLDGILRFINLAMASNPENEKATEYLNDCKTGLRRMAGIVNSLLDFSRNRPPVRHNVGINEAISEAVGLMRLKAEAINVEIDCRTCEDIPPLPCGEIVQVIMNLLKNAFDAMPDGGKVTVTSSRQGEWAVVEILDTGEGMPEEVASRIFDPFFTTKPPSKGTGLGLAISHDIIERHGGTLGMESEPGEGTVFRIALPIP